MSDKPTWNGVDRRKVVADPDELAQLKVRIEGVEKIVRCLKQSDDDFNRTYGDLLKDTLEAKALKSKLWAAVAEELVRKGVWAALGLIVTAVWFYLQHGNWPR